MSTRPRPGAALALLLLAITAPSTAYAQAVRGTATSTIRYIDMRPILQDTVSRERVTELPDGTFEFEGQRVSCVGDLPCVYFRSLDVQHAVVATQDVSLTGWGLGVQGLSVTAMMRLRGDLGGELVWPRSDDHFDAMLAYAELNRGMWRARLGRQRTTSGLGFSGYDGLSAVVDPLDWLAVEAYGGRSLARGLNEPRNEALQGIEDFVLDRNAWVLGTSVRAQLPAGAQVSARYQRDIWASRTGLVSER
ncbi:MAG TPA: hypothetical protein VK928_13975, partial [Longimicrobiales bacterium]|nr:hypothetical protein [Longimicrobiales bacterium]